MDDYCPACNAGKLPQRFFLDNIEPDCLSCQGLARSLRHFYPPDGPRGKVILSFDSDDASPVVRVRGVDEDDQPTGLTYYVKTAQDAQIVDQAVGKFFLHPPLGRAIEAVPSGQLTLEQILAWDADCQRLHPKCQRKTPRLPSRVIDVRLVNGECRLDESKGAHANYMTLSHCWGKLPILTTKKGNINAHIQGIPLKALPKTFQDAILITAQLGIQYLWIDSLCIVQDDTDDWAKESSMMASIYNNSYLTLAATAAKDGSGGLFKPRDTDTHSFTVTNPSNPAEYATICSTKRRKHDCFRGIDEAPEDTSTALPLMTRAWVFQERLLSPRLLHFSSDELVWECQETTRCECGHVPDYRQFEENRKNEGDKLGPAPPDRILFQELARDRHWYRLVSSYTLLNLTKGDDRLPAFSGIASTLIDADDYLAGLRRSHLPGDLLWSTAGTPPSGRPSSFQAPSWSWASVVARISPPPGGHHAGNNDKNDILAHVRNVFTTPSTSDRFGRVNGGELRISGPYFKASVLRKDQSEVIGSTFGRHHLRLEVPALPPHLWPSEAVLDTVEDAREAIGSSVTLLAILSAWGDIRFLTLAPHPSDPGKVQRRGVTTLTPFNRGQGKASKVPVQEILAQAETGDFVIV